MLQRTHRVLLLMLTALLVLGALQAPAQAATTRYLSITASPTAALAGTAVTFSGKLSPTPKGSKVTLQRRSGTKWVTAKATVTTASTGQWSARITLPTTPATYSFRAIAPVRGTLKAATSRTLAVAALRKVTVTIKATPITLDAGTSTTFTGTVRPFLTNTKLTIQKKVGTGWVTATSTTVTSTGSFTKGLTIKTSGIFRASVARAGLNSAAVSAGTGVFATPVIETTSLPSTNVGATYATTLTNIGDVPGTWSAAGLPTGLTLNTGSGVISGTPSAQGTAQVLIGFTQATTNQVAAAKTLPLVVGPAIPPVITTIQLPSGKVGDAYSVQTTATGGPGTWSATGLPAGLTISTGGLISGTPTYVGPNQVNHNVVLTFTNTVSNAADSDAFNLTIQPPAPPVILTSSLPDGAFLAAYSAQLQISGGVAGTWSATGLPSGLSVDPATGLISGTVTALPSTATVTVGFTAAGTLQPAAPKQLSLTVGLTPPTVKAVASAGGAFSCRTDSARKLWCWGYDESGQLGHGGPINTNRTVLKPEQVGTATDWSGVTTGGSSLVSERHACAIRGTAGYCWGSDKTEQLGSSTSTGSSTSPVLIAGGHAWSQLSAGWTSTCGVTTAGALYCWGGDLFGQLGIGGGGAANIAVPTRVGSASDWVQVSIGYTHTCAVKGDNTVWCWGMNSRGQLGTGTSDSTNAPVKVSGIGLWSSVAVAGSARTCATRTNGTLWCWGATVGSQFGGTGDALAPLQIGSATNWTSVAMGAYATCATNAAGEVWCFTSGALTKVGTDTDWTSVSVGDAHTCAAKAAGTIWCWGSNSKGQLGINSGDPAPVANPTQVVG